VKNYKKIILSFCLLFISALISIIINYKNTGVFLNVKKRLPIYCVDVKDKKLAMSFNASWGKDNTIKILNILDKYDVKATFFLVGGWIDEHENEVKEIYKRGHEIGNHSNMHPDMTKISKDKIKQEIYITDAKIRKITGKSSKVFRCPEGAYNNLVVDTVEEMGNYCIQWDVDSIDWKEEDVSKEYHRVIDKAKPGSIILFHTYAKNTPENLPKIIEKLQNKGYKFVKVGDLIYKDNYKIDHLGKQIPN
jgi:polysaccharide deacetylase family sporulation protein PdaB